MASRIKRLRGLMSAHSLDSILITSDINRNYLTGFSGTSGALVLGPKKTCFTTDSRYLQQAQREVKDAEVVLQTKALFVEIVGLIKKLKCRKLGIEAMHMSVAEYEYLKQQLPSVKLLPVQAIVEKLRQVKDSREQALMRQAAVITDRCFHHILKIIRPGLQERELAVEMEYYMRSQGASGLSFESIVASGWRGALPHGIASKKKIERGDLVVIDFGCIYQGYCSDMTRTVAVGKVSPLQRKVYKIVQRAQAQALKAIKAGKRAEEIDLRARAIIKRAGYARNFGHGLGHGVGVEVHEEPRVGPTQKKLLQEGEAITVEPGIYLKDKFGVRIEDLVIVTKDGSENLYRSTKDLIVV